MSDDQTARPADVPKAPEKAPDKPALATDPAKALDQKIMAEAKAHSEIVKNLTYMCDFIGGRLTGSPALKKANDWTAEVMKSYGLENVHLEPYEISKGTIRFPLTEPVPLKLIESIAKFRADHLKAREKGRRGKNSRDVQLERIRRICATMPSVSEKLSHGAPTFFVEKDKGVFTMFVDNHHEDGHRAVWLPAPAGLQSALIGDAPATYFKPPYVGSSGWIGIELDQIRDEALEIHVREAWEVAAGKKKNSRQRA